VLAVSRSGRRLMGGCRQHFAWQRCGAHRFDRQRLQGSAALDKRSWAADEMKRRPREVHTDGQVPSGCAGRECRDVSRCARCELDLGTASPRRRRVQPMCIVQPLRARREGVAGAGKIALSTFRYTNTARPYASGRRGRRAARHARSRRSRASASPGLRPRNRRAASRVARRRRAASRRMTRRSHERRDAPWRCPRATAPAPEVRSAVVVYGTLKHDLAAPASLRVELLEGGR